VTLDVYNNSNNNNTFALLSPKAIYLLPGEHRLYYGRLEWGGKNWRAGAQKKQCLKRVKREEKLLDGL